MSTAYTNANLLSSPDYVDYYSGSIGGLTLSPGLYKWSSDVSILADVYISGLPTDVWVF
jgi:hypothetical protein